MIDFIQESINLVMGLFLIGCILFGFIGVFIPRSGDDNRYNGAGTLDH